MFVYVFICIDGVVEFVVEYFCDMSEIVFVLVVGGVYDIVMEVCVGLMLELYELFVWICGSVGVFDISMIIYLIVVKGFFVFEYYGGVILDVIDEVLIE